LGDVPRWTGGIATVTPNLMSDVRFQTSDFSQRAEPTSHEKLGMGGLRLFKPNHPLPIRVYCLTLGHT